MRVRKLFIFYNYKNHSTYVGVDDGQTLESGFIDSTPFNKMLLGGLRLEMFLLLLVAVRMMFSLIRVEVKQVE